MQYVTQQEDYLLNPQKIKSKESLGVKIITRNLGLTDNSNYLNSTTRQSEGVQLTTNFDQPPL